MRLSRLLLLTAGSILLAACVITVPTAPAAKAPAGQQPAVIKTVPAPATVVVVVPAAPAKTSENSMYVCTLSAFTSNYRAEDSNRGRARLTVKRQCVDEFDEMFCQDKDIRCTEYK